MSDANRNKPLGETLAGVLKVAGTAVRPSGMAEAKKPDLSSLLSSAIESTGEAMLITGDNGRILWASKPFCDRYLAGKGDVTGQDRKALLDLQARSFKDPRLFRENLLSLLADPFRKGEAEWELSDGHTIVHLRTYPVRDEAGKLLGRVETYRDEEPGTMACLAERDVLDAIPVGMITVDEHLNLVYYNRSGADFVESRLGLATEELKSFESLGMDHPVTRAVIEAISRDKQVRISYYRPPAGDEAYFDITVTPLAAHGHVDGAAITLVDSTGQYRELKKVERERDLGDFFINLMSHDIRNFNQVSSGYLEMLELSENLTEEERSYLAKAQSGVAGSNRLIENVRMVRAIMESGDKNIAPTDLSKILREDIDKIVKAHAGQPVQINAHLKEGSMVLANQYIHEIFTHILENSIKYDQHPEKVIDLEVTESSFEGKDYWTIRITDRGRGIPEDRRKAIFERIGQTTKGSGIGLSMVNLIVNKLGGRIWVEDRVPGQTSEGSVFVVQLRKA